VLSNESTAGRRDRGLVDLCSDASQQRIVTHKVHNHGVQEACTHSGDFIV